MESWKSMRLRSAGRVLLLGGVAGLAPGFAAGVTRVARPSASTASTASTGSAGRVCASGNFDWGQASPEDYAKFFTCVMLSGPVLVGYTQTLNDWYDKDLDAINEPYRPIPSGRITEDLCAFKVVGVFMAYIYSAPPLKLKQNWITGCYALGSSYIALPWLAGQCTFGQVTPEIIALTLWYSVAAVGIAIRRPFLGVIGESGELIPGGLYLDYARLTYYDGASLLFLMILVLVAGGSLGQTWCPLILVSLLVSLLTVLELVAPLAWVASLGWKKACMLALLLKIFWLRLCIGLALSSDQRTAMTAIRSSCFERLGCIGRPLELWLDALCMFRDILVSSIIFLALCPLVLLSGISEFICPTFSIHHLIIYRQPGHTDRENLDFDPILIRMCDSDLCVFFASHPISIFAASATFPSTQAAIVADGMRRRRVHSRSRGLWAFVLLPQAVCQSFPGRPGTASTCPKSEWVDPETPSSACASQYDSAGQPLTLVFSDEFNVPGRPRQPQMPKCTVVFTKS
eukprot:g31533.t1